LEGINAVGSHLKSGSVGLRPRSFEWTLLRNVNSPKADKIEPDGGDGSGLVDDEGGGADDIQDLDIVHDARACVVGNAQIICRSVIIEVS
jgi:hypothetical protein